MQELVSLQEGGKVPYRSVRDLPAQTRKLSPHKKRVFRAAFNAAFSRYGEERAFKIAWAATKKMGRTRKRKAR